MRTSIFAIAAFLAITGVSFSDTILVPDDYPTIQAGIDAAASGDTVLVAPGTYFENIDFNGKAIVVKSSDGPEATVIDGNRWDSVVKFENNEGHDSKLNGFTLQNGFGEGGGGIDCSGASPIIRNNIIIRNLTDGFYKGGGIACYDSSAIIKNNKITKNSGPFPYSRGGGIYCGYDSSMKITGNIITKNSASSGAGGIYCYESAVEITDNFIAGNETVDNGGGGIWCNLSTITISGNTITGNSTVGLWGSGGGIQCDNSSVVVANNMVHDNLAQGGGGIYFDDSSGIIEGNSICDNSSIFHGGGIICYECSPDIMNNMIVQNAASTEGGGLVCTRSSPRIINNTIACNISVYEGSGLFIRHTSFPEAMNNIFWDNHSGAGSQIYIGMYLTHSSSLAISYSDIQGGPSSIHVESGCVLNWGSGMIDSDPLFVDAAIDDMHLYFNSPCRGLGTNEAPSLPDFDFEGDPRIHQGTVDMGADEFHDHLYCTGAFTPGREVEGKFVGLPGTEPVMLLVGFGKQEPPMPTKWGDLYLTHPWFYLPVWWAIPADGVLVLQAKLSNNLTVPIDLYMQALIGQHSEALTNLFVMEIR